MITTTPINPQLTAIHCPRVTFSPSNGPDRAATNNGAKKLTAVFSANGMYSSPKVKNSPDPSKQIARYTCSNGRLLRSTRSPD